MNVSKSIEENKPLRKSGLKNSIKSGTKRDSEVIKSGLNTMGYSVKSGNGKKLPSLNSSKDVSKIAEKVEKDFERKEKDFIIQILTSSVPLQPILEAKQTQKIKKNTQLKSPNEVAQDILEIKAAKPHLIHEIPNADIEEERGLKTMSASLPVRQKVTHLNQRAYSSTFISEGRTKIKSIEKSPEKQLSLNEDDICKSQDKMGNTISQNVCDPKQASRYHTQELKGPSFSLKDLPLSKENTSSKVSISTTYLHINAENKYEEVNEKQIKTEGEFESIKNIDAYDLSKKSPMIKTNLPEARSSIFQTKEKCPAKSLKKTKDDGILKKSEEIEPLTEVKEKILKMNNDALSSSQSLNLGGPEERPGMNVSYLKDNKELVAIEREQALPESIPVALMSSEKKEERDGVQNKATDGNNQVLSDESTVNVLKNPSSDVSPQNLDDTVNSSLPEPPSISERESSTINIKNCESLREESMLIVSLLQDEKKEIPTQEGKSSAHSFSQVSNKKGDSLIFKSTLSPSRNKKQVSDDIKKMTDKRHFFPKGRTENLKKNEVLGLPKEDTGDKMNEGFGPDEEKKLPEMEILENELLLNTESKNEARACKTNTNDIILSKNNMKNSYIQESSTKNEVILEVLNDNIEQEIKLHENNSNNDNEKAQIIDKYSDTKTNSVNEIQQTEESKLTEDFDVQIRITKKCPETENDTTKMLQYSENGNPPNGLSYNDKTQKNIGKDKEDNITQQAEHLKDDTTIMEQGTQKEPVSENEIYEGMKTETENASKTANLNSHNDQSVLPLVDAICLNIPFSLDDKTPGFETPTVMYYADNVKFEGKIKSENKSPSSTDKWRVIPLQGDSKDSEDDTVSTASSILSHDEERALSAKLKKFIDKEGLDQGLYERYKMFLQSKDLKNNEDSTINTLNRETRFNIRADEDTLYVIINEIKNLMAINNEQKGQKETNSLECCSFGEGKDTAGKGQKSRNQSQTQLGTKFTNENASHAENLSSSQSGSKKACSTIKSIENSDLKLSLTSSRNSKPQVPVANSHLTNNPFKKKGKPEVTRKKFPWKENSIKLKGHEIKHVTFKEENLVYSSPPAPHPRENSEQSRKKCDVSNQANFSEHTESHRSIVTSGKNNFKDRKVFSSKLSTRERSDMLARQGPTAANYSRFPSNRHLPPIAGTHRPNQNWNATTGYNSDDNMVFDFLNPFKKYRTRGRRGRVPIAVKPNPIKAQKGYEYEDLNSRRKQYQETRRNSASKIYIQDPDDANNILVAEEIGYVYGDPRKHIQQLKPTKESRGIQTVPLKDKSRSASRAKKKTGGYLVNRFKERKLPKPFTRSYDLQAASKLETPREKGDYVIFPSKNATKTKTKSVSFKDAERGTPSISSTILQDPRDRLYGNKRDAATDSQNFLMPNDPYSNYSIISKRIPAVTPYVNGIPSVHPMRNSVLERRASFDGPLPPVRARASDRMNGEFYNQIHHASSHPNLGQGSSGTLLLPQEGYPESPLRTYGGSELLSSSSRGVPKSRTGKKGWARLKELTISNKKDTVIDGFDGSTTDLSLGSSIARMPGTKVPIVLLQGFFKNARGERTNRPPPSKSEARKLTLPKNLLEPNSLLRGALPILPTYLAAFCLTLNIFVPGLGTLMSGWFGALAGRSRLDNTEKEGQKFISITITAITGVVQMFTVTFFLVGWFWSISWGILLVSIARKYNQFLVDYRFKNRNVGYDVLTVNTN